MQIWPPQPVRDLHLTRPNHHESHGHPHETVAGAGLNQPEIVVLQTMRLLCMSYANPASHAWEGAFENCVAEFGPKHGPQIGLAVMNCIRSLRSTRKTGFGFVDPSCPCCRHCLAQHEYHFMKLLKAQGADDGLDRQSCALVLCEGEEPDVFLRNMKTLADRLAEFSSPRKAGHPLTRKRLKFSGSQRVFE